MTLCIAWKNGNNIRFSSDSRFSIDDDHYADIGIKVMQIPVIIKNPTPVETGIEEIIYNHKLGMCYCRDTTNAFLIKETIAEVLQNLQLLPGYTDFSLRGICNVIVKFLENTSDHLRDGMDWDPDVEFLIGGYCPENLRVMVYKFQLVDYGDHFETMCDEVLEDDNDMIIMGSGTDKAEELITAGNIQPGNKLLKVLRDVCNDDSVPSVGGHIQYGQFDNNDFRILGVNDYKILPDGQIEYIYAYRGTVFYKDKFEANENDYHIATNFIMPFQDEIDEYWRQQGI
ncbi:hypothetical protein FHS57_000817 [Runella defluvii]|uniref:Uncharacterized protein n=1 Tax=Runella defluvii TaxID=370973 RepID=A0A7W6ENQ9_9BACT|nr:hypothetical protein [Runella defluvii]MBB3836835.1 hypothetical protein [Runella defluvii]